MGGNRRSDAPWLKSSFTRALSAGVPEAELLADYPDLELEDLRACYGYAAELVESERVFRVPNGTPV